MNRIYLTKLLVVATIMLGFNLASFAQSQTFSSPGGPYQYTVGPGITGLGVDASGAKGGDSYNNTYGLGGAGGRVQCVLSVTPGQVLYIYIGGAGANGNNSCCTQLAGGVNGGGKSGGDYYPGGGGGGSDIRLTNQPIGTYTTTNRVVVAAGGGGAGGAESDCKGGDGGGLTGSPGHMLGSAPYSAGYGTYGGTQSSGGATGTYCTGCGNTSGALGIGGDAIAYGGGGGGGYYGGGGGYDYPGGGGGSSYAAPGITASVTHTPAYNTAGNGKIILSAPNLGFIVGNTPTCVGTSFTLISTGSGGSWATSDPTIATIGAATGVVTGTGAGTAIITYSANLGAGGSGYITTVVTVNPSPAAIGGTLSACPGTTTTLTDAGGGVWTSSAPLFATIGSSTGVVMGIVPGSTTVTYTLPVTGCAASATVVINPLPANITGTTTTCASGGTTTLNSSTPGGSWTSSNPTIATVSGTGVVSGVTAGGAIVTYTLPTQCMVTANVSVNPLPSPITGVTNVCVNNSTTLSDGGGGSWSSGNTAIASVVPLTGSVTGISAGTVNISFTSSSGCSISTAVLVNPLPSAIGGTASACIGDNATLNSATGGGVWGSNNLTIASAVPSTGVVTGLTAGTATISYTLGTGCAATKTFTVNPLPTAFTISGGGGYCTGGSGVHVGLSFANAGVNYKLYNGATLVATSGGSNAGLDFGVENAVGTYSVIGVDAVTGCTAAMAGTTTISINPLPNVYTTSGGGSFCPGGAGAHINLSSSDAGINYALYLGGVATGSSVTGTGASLDFGAQTLAGNYTVVAANTTTGCSMNMTGSANVSLNALPAVYNLNSGGGYCAGGTGVDIVLSGSATGASYQLYNSGVASGSAVPGTGSPIHFGPHTLPGTYTVIATNTASLCTSNMLGNSVITVNPLPNVYGVTGGGTYCAGGDGVHISLSFSDAGINYQLFRGSTPAGSPMPGSNAGLDFGLQTGIGTYSVIATNPVSGCIKNMTGTATAATTPLPNTYTVTGGGNYCVGGNGVHVRLSGSNTGIQYQLMYAGNPSGAAMTGTGAGLDFGLQTAAGSYTVVATNTTTSCTNNMLSSASVSVSTLPNAYVVTGLGTSYCAGSGGIDVMISGSDFGVNYQLYRGASPVGVAWPGSGGAIDFGSQTGSGNYVVIATDAVTGCHGTMTGSAPITQNPLPTAFSVTGGGSYCTGGAGVHLGLSGSSVGVDYQLINSVGNVGGPMGGIGSGLDFGLNTVADIYTVIATDAVTGCTNNMTGSANITINALPTAFNVTGGGSYCLGTSGAPVGLDGSDLGVRYQLMKGTATAGAAMNGSATTIDFGNHIAGTYTVMATDVTTNCSSIMTGSAEVDVLQLPNVQSVTGGGSYCEGGTGLDISLANSDAGVDYELFYGSTSIATMSGTGTNLDFGLQTGTGTYNIVATDLSTTCSSNMSGTAIITTQPTPAVQTVTGGGGYCVGGTGVHVGLAASDATIQYQLYLFGSPVGTPVAGTGSAIDFGAQMSAGDYTVVASPTGICMANMAGLATVTINPLPSMYPLTGGGTYCSAGAGVHVGLSNSDAGITYQLYQGTTALGSAVAGTGSSIDFGLETLSGSYMVTAIDSATMCSSASTSGVSVNVLGAPTAYNVAGGGAYCTGGSGVHVTLNRSTTNVNYQLYHAGALVGSAEAGTGTLIDFGLQTAIGQYTVIGTDAATGCMNNMMDTANVSINPVLTPSFNIGGQVSIKKQQRDTLSAAGLTNGGTGTMYQWLLNGFPISGATNSSYVSNNFANGDSITLQVTSGSPCGGVTTSKSVKMVVSSNVGVQQITAASSNVNVIPNPNKGTFSITGSLGTAADQEVSVELTDMVGHTIYSSKFVAKGGDVNEQVSVGNVANGMYILSLRSESENKVFHVVIEQ